MRIINNIFFRNIYIFESAIIALTLTSFLTLTHIRMYGHDTRGWILPSRTWFVDVLRHGDLPLWFGLVRYGFPSTVAQFSHGIWSPVAAFLGVFGDYGSRTIAYEFFIWRIILLSGSYYVSKNINSNKKIQWCISATIIASGSLSSQDIQLGVYCGLAVVPLIIGSIDRIIAGRSWSVRFLGAGVLGLSGSTLLWSGYPGIWLMLPVYLTPYVICNFIDVKLLKNKVKSFVLLLSSIGIASLGGMPIIIDTLNFSVFGDHWRVSTDANYGLLAASGISGFLLANPSYVADIGNAKNTPVYIGIIPIIGIICYILYILKILNIKIQKILMIGCIILDIIAIIMYRLDFLAMCVLFQGAMLLNMTYFTFNKKYYKYIITILWIMIWTTPGTYTDYLRGHMIPFSMVRWQAMQMYLVDIFAAVMGWSIVGELVMKSKQEIHGKFWFQSSQNVVVRGCLLIGVVGLFVFSPPVGMSEFALGQVEHFGGTPLVWTAVSCSAILGACILAYVIARWHKLQLGEFSFEGAIAAGVLLVACGAWIYSEISGSNPPDWWYQMVVLPEGSRAALDVGHLIVVSGLALGAIRVAKSPAWLLNTLVLIGVTDVSVASLRYLGDTEMVNVERVREHAAVPRVTSNRRFDADAGTSLIALASPAPHMWVYPGVMPDVARVDDEWGDPSVFREFAVFPAAWTELQDSGSANDARAIAVSGQSMRGQVDAGSAQPLCALGDRVSEPVVTIQRFLSTIVDVTVVSPCSRLLVWTDTWSEGWTATLNDVPTDVYRVNGAVRGVMITSGETRLAWRYSPTGFLWSLGVMVAALIVSLIFIFWGLLDDHALWVRFLATRVSEVSY